LTSSNLRVEVKSTNKLYYDRYRYCASAYLPYASSLRRQNHYHIDAALDLRETLHQSYPDLRALVHGQYLRNPPITSYVRDDLHLFLNNLQSIEQDYKLVLSKHHFHFYTNCESLIDTVLYEGLLDRKVTKLNIDYEPSTIVRKKSDYRYRCYFKNTQVSETAKDNMRHFFRAHPEIKVANSLQHWLKISYKYTSSHYFFDYNDQGMKLMFELTAPGVVRESYTIITEDELNRG
jgi:hypothetical protein